MERKMANAQYMNMNPFMKMFENMDMSKQFNVWGKSANMDMFKNMDMGSWVKNMQNAANVQDNMQSMMNMWSNKGSGCSAPSMGASMEGAESMSQMGQRLSENAQAVMMRKAEILQSHASDLFNLMKDLSSSRDPESMMSKQADFARSTYEGLMGDYQELTEMVGKSSLEAFEMLSAEMSKTMNKYNKSVNKASAKKKS
jgi:phasin family protein